MNTLAQLQRVARVITFVGGCFFDLRFTARRRYDKKRKGKKVSNEEWVSPNDTESRITQLNDRRTHLACRAEHVVDLKSDIVLAAEIYQADQADTETLVGVMGSSFG